MIIKILGQSFFKYKCYVGWSNVLYLMTLCTKWTPLSWTLMTLIGLLELRLITSWICGTHLLVLGLIMSWICWTHLLGLGLVTSWICWTHLLRLGLVTSWICWTHLLGLGLITLITPLDRNIFMNKRKKLSRWSDIHLTP